MQNHVQMWRRVSRLGLRLAINPVCFEGLNLFLGDSLPGTFYASNYPQPWEPDARNRCSAFSQSRPHSHRDSAIIICFHPLTRLASK